MHCHVLLFYKKRERQGLTICRHWRFGKFFNEQMLNAFLVRDLRGLAWSQSSMQWDLGADALSDFDLSLHDQHLTNTENLSRQNFNYNLGEYLKSSEFVRTASILIFGLNFQMGDFVLVTKSRKSRSKVLTTATAAGTFTLTTCIRGH